jgi:hypothetical protein
MDEAMTKPVTEIHITLYKDIYYIQCPKCRWSRGFGTQRGAVQHLTEHCLRVHRVQLFLPRMVAP